MECQSDAYSTGTTTFAHNRFAALQEKMAPR